MPKLLNKVNLPRYSSAPSTPSEADLYYNTSDDKIYVYTGAAWVEVGSGAGGSGVFYQSSEPSSPSDGDIWIDSDDEVASVTSVTDSTSTTSSTVAASATAVKAAYDLATTKAKVSVGTTAPVTPSTGDVWVDTAGTATAINAVPLAALTGTGAMIYGASAGTAATLAIGTDSQVLSVSGGVPAWTTPAAGGGMTLIATATPSAATSVSFTSIPSTYKHLLLIVASATQSATSVSWKVRLNGSSSGYNWATIAASTTNNVGASNSASGLGDYSSAAVPPVGTAATDYYRHAQSATWIYRYAEAENKTCQWWSKGYDETYTMATGFGQWRNTTAVNEVSLVRSSTQTITGTIYLYGVS
jgi:hypothetical protein